MVFNPQEKGSSFQENSQAIFRQNWKENHDLYLMLYPRTIGGSSGGLTSDPDALYLPYCN